MYQIVPELVLI